MNGLHDPLQQSNGRMAEREAAQGGELTIQSEVARLTTLKDDLTSRLETYYTILRTVHPPLPPLPYPIPPKLTESQNAERINPLHASRRSRRIPKE